MNAADDAEPPGSRAPLVFLATARDAWAVDDDAAAALVAALQEIGVQAEPAVWDRVAEQEHQHG